MVFEHFSRHQQNSGTYLLPETPLMFPGNSLTISIYNFILHQEIWYDVIFGKIDKHHLDTSNCC